MRQKPAQPKSLAATARGYASLLTDIKQRIRTAQVRAALMSNASTLMLYWKIGGELERRQKQEGWGSKVLPRLAAALKNELPGEKGFSERNLKRMQRFAREYPELFPKGPQPVAQLDSAAVIRTRAVAKLDRRLPLAKIAQHIATAISIEPEDLELSPFNQRGGLGKPHQVFGDRLNPLWDELNATVAA